MLDLLRQKKYIETVVAFLLAVLIIALAVAVVWWIAKGTYTAVVNATDSKAAGVGVAALVMLVLSMLGYGLEQEQEQKEKETQHTKE
ncbi:hypothetical protein D6833_07205 [Candidatus Parcubacteria bacterium]|nr:MAG: hypothetical protein D6833_07205 [Candidatus Parcubacteria bacterium]